MTTTETYIDGRLVAPAEVRSWESRRARSVLTKLTSRVGTLGMADLLPGVDRSTLDNAEADMIAACPDHYLLRGLPDGRQEVVETTGGSPTATRFVVDYTTGDQVSVLANPEYPLQVAGQAILDDGLVIGGVRHQFRDLDGAMEAVLTVEFPRLFPSRMVTEHRWHLATEFGNWIAAFQR